MMFISSEKRSCFSPKYAAPIVLMVHLDLAANIFTGNATQRFTLFYFNFFFQKGKTEHLNFCPTSPHRVVVGNVFAFLHGIYHAMTLYEMLCSRLFGCERSKIEKLTFELTIFPIPTSKQLPAISVGKSYSPLKRQSAKLLVGFLSGFLVWANRQVP